MPALPNLRLISHKSSICFFERFAWQAVFSRPFFQKNYPHSLAKCLSCRCRQQREKYAVLRQGQSVSCQSKILPRCQNPHICGFAPLVNLVGECLPQTLLMRPVGRERRSTLEEKIQHTPPLPCGQNPHDRGRIRRLYRAAETL